MTQIEESNRTAEGGRQGEERDCYDKRDAVRRYHGDISSMTLWRWMRDLDFPPPDRTINGIDYWKRSTHEAWQPPAEATKKRQRPGNAT